MGRSDAGTHRDHGWLDVSDLRRVTVTLDPDVVRQLTDAAHDAGVSRSRLIAALIENAHWVETIEDMQALGAARSVTEDAEIAAAGTRETTP